MELKEFRAWFEGFTEGFKGKPPNKEQWAKIRKRVSEITNDPTTRIEFVDRWVRPWRPYWTKMGLASLEKSNYDGGPALLDWKNAGRAEVKYLASR
ncbi:MAG TPA: hypothetical protein VFR24_27660 [Candidatus Angelobacter sp.]|nr:hypothetical protein [Candidatus Angelobacter sp.]